MSRKVWYAMCALLEPFVVSARLRENAVFEVVGPLARTLVRRLHNASGP